ncbi:MAG: tetratricopeptide repeat protein, partial [Dysgonamonadaceae bacterium]|nr:tetratricopeptide repeat protein [Dysgonamonadaceae bacterium]
MNKTTCPVLLAMLGICATVKAQDASVILAQADSLSKAENYAGAIALLEKNIKLFETETPDDALVWSRLGDYRYSTQDYEQAKTCYLKYLDSRKPYLESNPAKYAYRYSNCLFSLLSTYGDLSDWQSAIRICKENIELIERYREHFENYASDLARRYGALSWYSLCNKDYLQAEQSAQKALSINNPQIWIRTNLAHALLLQGKTREAEDIYNELMQPVYNDDDTYASTLLDDFEELEKVKAIPHNIKQDVERIKTDISKINESVEIYNQFRSLYKSGKYEEAILLIQPYKDRLSEHHAQWASNVIENKGHDELVNSNDYALTERYWLEAKDIREKALGKEHPDYVTSLNNLGGFYDDMGDNAQAEKYYAEAKEITERTLGKEHPDYAASLNNLGSLYSKMGNYA